MNCCNNYWLYFHPNKASRQGWFMTATHPNYLTRFNIVAIPWHNDVYFGGNLENNLQGVTARSSGISHKAATEGPQPCLWDSDVVRRLQNLMGWGENGGSQIYG